MCVRERESSWLTKLVPDQQLFAKQLPPGGSHATMTNDNMQSSMRLTQTMEILELGRNRCSCELGKRDGQNFCIVMVANHKRGGGEWKMLWNTCLLVYIVALFHRVCPGKTFGAGIAMASVVVLTQVGQQP